jgi:IS30 family transposase
MVEDTLSQEREHARVPRNHLPQLIHPGTGSVEKRAGSALAVQAADTPLTALAGCGQSRGQIVDAISIRERPAEIEDRAIPGHWEGDLLAGTKNSHIATLVERHSRFTMLVKVPSKDTATVVAALSRHVRKLPASLRRSLTWDRGLEMAKHKSFTVATNVQVFFCDPQSPWQRGTNENTNGLLRQYFPKKTDLSGYSQADLDKVALRLNQRPRKTLGFETPASKLQASVASIH